MIKPRKKKIIIIILTLGAQIQSDLDNDIAGDSEALFDSLIEAMPDADTNETIGEAVDAVYEAFNGESASTNPDLYQLNSDLERALS